MLLSLTICSANVYAQDDEGEGLIPDEVKQQYQELLENSGAGDLFSLLPKDATELMKENQITSIDADKLLCALLNSLKSSFNDSSYERVFSVVSVMCIATTIIIPIAQMITKTADVIKQVSTFILSFIPVYVGIITASGKPISAVSYNLSLIGVVQVVSRISASVLVPLLAIYLAFCLIGATSTQINIDGFAKSVKTIVIVVLSFLMTVFVGLLTVQGIVATSSDTVALKATKFALSAFLPVVGTAISEALNSVQGCMGLIRSTVGGFGIVAIVATFLPSVISVLMMQLSLSISVCISEMLDTSRITSLLRSAASVLSLLLGILLVYFILLIVSITIMLTLSTTA